MNWFYNKVIIPLNESPGELKHGSYVPGGYVQKESILCDVQPSTKELVYKEYGFYVDCSKRVFCDKCDLKEGNLIKYDNDVYKIVKLIEWDDYFDIFMQKQGEI